MSLMQKLWRSPYQSRTSLAKTWISRNSFIGQDLSNESTHSNCSALVAVWDVTERAATDNCADPTGSIGTALSLQSAELQRPLGFRRSGIRVVPAHGSKQF